MLCKLARQSGAAALILALATASATAAGCGPDKLGTERTLTLSTTGGFAVGLQTYPKTLALADHEVVLTFDDGPWPTTTPRVLDALAKECVKATFFLIGRNAQAYPALARREVAEGHSIGNHTFSHPGRTLRLMRNAAARADIDHGFAADETSRLRQRRRPDHILPLSGLCRYARARRLAREPQYRCVRLGLLGFGLAFTDAAGRT